MEEMGKETTFRVSASTNFRCLQKAIVETLKVKNTLCVDTIGATPNHIGTKAIIYAHADMINEGKKLICFPIYKNIWIADPRDGQHDKIGVRWGLQLV